MTTTHKKVLIVEDDQLLGVSLTSRFETAGFEVFLAGDGEAGEELFAREQPDALIMDIMMPKKDGLEMLADIRKQFPDTKIPVIVLTNSDDLSHVADAMSRDISAFIPKSDEHIDGIVALVSEKLKDF